MGYLFDIIAVGSNTVDAFVKTEAELIRHHCRGEPKLGRKSNDICLAYPVGEKILIKHLEFQVGGGGTNTAVAFSRLGLKTAYLGKIGDDENGVKVFRLLKQENVKFIGAIGKSTGFSVVLDSIENDRTILTHKGCNNELSYHELNTDFLISKWFYFSSMMGKSLETLKHIARFAILNNIKVAFNPSSYLVKKGFKICKPILEACSILILNKEEACTLSGKKNIDNMLKSLKIHIKDFVVITDGENGAYCYDGRTRYYSKPKRNIKIVETTGAGDAFASAFVVGIIKGKDTKTALKMGFIQAESVIQAYGSKNDLLSVRKMNEKLNKERRKMEIKKMG